MVMIRSWQSGYSRNDFRKWAKTDSLVFFWGHSGQLILVKWHHNSGSLSDCLVFWLLLVWIECVFLCRGCCTLRRILWGLFLVRWRSVPAESCLHGSHTPSTGRSGDIRKWGRNQQSPFRQSVFPYSSKTGNWKEPVFFPLSFPHSWDWIEDWRHLTAWLTRVNASGCSSHYQQGLLVGNAWSSCPHLALFPTYSFLPSPYRQSFTDFSFRNQITMTIVGLTKCSTRWRCW